MVSLDVSACTLLGSLDGLANLPIKYLGAAECRSLTSIAALAGSTALKQLSLVGSTALTSVTPLAQLTVLEHLNVTGCSSLLMDVERLQKLLPDASIYGPDPNFHGSDC